MDKFVAYKIIDGDLEEYFLQCSRINGNTARESRTLTEMLEMLEEDVRDLYEGGEMSLSFEVPPDAVECVALDESEQKVTRLLFDRVLVVCRPVN